MGTANGGYYSQLLSVVALGEQGIPGNGKWDEEDTGDWIEEGPA